MKNKAILMLLVLFIFCVGCVSATDTDNINNTMIQDNPDNNIADEIDIEKNNINSTNEPNNMDNDDNPKNKIENNNLTEKNNDTSTKNDIKRYFDFNITSFDPNVKVNITECEEEFIIEIHTNTTLKNNNIILDIDGIIVNGFALNDGHLKFKLAKLGPNVMLGYLYRMYDFNIGTHNISVFFNQTGDYEKVFTITLHSNNTNYTQPVPDWYKEDLKDIEGEKNLPDYEEEGTMKDLTTNKTVTYKIKRLKAKDADWATISPELLISSKPEPKILNIQMSNKSNVISKNIQINNKNKSPIVKLTLNKIVPKKSSKKITIKAKLTINNKKIKGKSVKIKFNNKIYDVKTDKNGIAKINIKKSVLKKLKAGKKIKYQAIYGKTTTTQTAKVKN